MGEFFSGSSSVFLLFRDRDVVGIEWIVLHIAPNDCCGFVIFDSLLTEGET